MIDKKIDKNKIEYIVNAFLNVVGCELKDDNIVKINGLGTFSPCVRKSYVGKNVNGKIEQISDTKYIRFTPSKKIK